MEPPGAELDWMDTRFDSPEHLFEIDRMQSADPIPSAGASWRRHLDYGSAPAL